MTKETNSFKDVVCPEDEDPPSPVVASPTPQEEATYQKCYAPIQV